MEIIVRLKMVKILYFNNNTVKHFSNGQTNRHWHFIDIEIDLFLIPNYFSESPTLESHSAKQIEKYFFVYFS